MRCVFGTEEELRCCCKLLRICMHAMCPGSVPTVLSPRRYLQVDPGTLSALQIFQEQRHASQMGIGKSREGCSVFALLQRCVTPMVSACLLQDPGCAVRSLLVRALMLHGHVPAVMIPAVITWTTNDVIVMIPPPSCRHHMKYDCNCCCCCFISGHAHAEGLVPEADHQSGHHQQ